MFNITIKDNYLTDVEQVREFAIKYNNWRISDQPDAGPRWKGMRSEKFKNIGDENLLKIEKDIFDFVWKERNLEDWRYPSSANYQIDETIFNEQIEDEIEQEIQEDETIDWTDILGPGFGNDFGERDATPI